MVRRAKAIALGTAFCLASTSLALAASNNDPDWPCVQRKVDAISIGQMWTLPLKETPKETKGEEKTETSLSDAAQKLAGILALRRVDEEQASKYVAEFATANPTASTEDYAHIYKAVLERLNHDRSRLIAGISRYAHSQQDRVGEIDKLRLDMEKAQAAEKPDFDAIDKLEEAIDWNERIYKERETSLTYVCETPVIIEQRAFMIAKVLMQQAEKAAK